jgi:hypothetical protein
MQLYPLRWQQNHVAASGKIQNITMMTIVLEISEELFHAVYRVETGVSVCEGTDVGVAVALFGVVPAVVSKL